MANLGRIGTVAASLYICILACSYRSHIPFSPGRVVRCVVPWPLCRASTRGAGHFRAYSDAILSGREFVGQSDFGVCILDIILGGCEYPILVGVDHDLPQGLA